MGLTGFDHLSAEGAMWPSRRDHLLTTSNEFPSLFGGDQHLKHLVEAVFVAEILEIFGPVGS